METGQFVDGAQVATYFVNHMITMRQMGPCCDFFFSAAADGTADMLPDLRIIAPRDFVLNTATRAIEFLRATVSPPLVPACGRFMS